MRILITNQSLDVRGGQEAIVRAMARQMNRYGHEVMVYGSDPARLGRLLESDLIPVTVNPAGLEIPPDVIHALNPLDALTAMLALPGTPVLYHVRENVWADMPPAHPGILHYLVESVERIEQLAKLHRIPRDNISLFSPPIDWEKAIERLLGIYEEVIQANKTRPIDPPDAERAVSRFLESWVLELMNTYAAMGKKFPPREEWFSGPASQDP